MIGREEGEDEDDWRTSARAFIFLKLLLMIWKKGGGGSGRKKRFFQVE